METLRRVMLLIIGGMLGLLLTVSVPSAQAPSEGADPGTTATEDLSDPDVADGLTAEPTRNGRMATVPEVDRQSTRNNEAVGAACQAPSAMRSASPTNATGNAQRVVGATTVCSSTSWLESWLDSRFRSSLAKADLPSPVKSRTTQCGVRTICPPEYG